MRSTLEPRSTALRAILLWMGLAALWPAGGVLAGESLLKTLDAPLLFVKRHPYMAGHIYDDYIAFLEAEITRLKEFRLSTLRKLAKEDLSRFSVYDRRIPTYLQALDAFIRPASPGYRRIYSLISEGIGFSERRAKLRALVGEWEEEVEKWEHSFVVLWKKLIAPLRSVLGPG